VSTERIAAVTTLCHKRRKKFKKSQIFAYFAAKKPKSHEKKQKIKVEAALTHSRINASTH
jgi:hypothetical protein